MGWGGEGGVANHIWGQAAVALEALGVVVPCGCASLLMLFVPPPRHPWGVLNIKGFVFVTMAIAACVADPTASSSCCFCFCCCCCCYCFFTVVAPPPPPPSPPLVATPQPMRSLSCTWSWLLCGPPWWHRARPSQAT
jgi:hypothetical protein